MAGRQWRETLLHRWEDRHAARPAGRLSLRILVGFVISMATVAVLFGVVLPAVGWPWTVVLIVAYSVNPLLAAGPPKSSATRSLGQ